MRTASSSLLAFAAVLVSCTSEYDLTGERPDVDPGEVTECGFTGVSGAYISSYDCNPVFTTTGEVQAADVGSVAFHTTEVLGHPFYQIWYVGFPEGGGYGTYSLGYAVSGDGTTWDTHPQNPLVASEGGNAWDRDIMDGVQIVWDDSGSRYVASYQGARVGTDPAFDPSVFGLGILTSPDGVTWTKHPGNPVIDFTADPFAVEPRVCWPLSLTSSASVRKGTRGGRIGTVLLWPVFVWLRSPDFETRINLRSRSTSLRRSAWISPRRRPVKIGIAQYARCCSATPAKKRGISSRRKKSRSAVCVGRLRTRLTTLSPRKRP